MTDPLINVPPPPKPSKPTISGTVICSKGGTGSVVALSCPAGVHGSDAGLSANSSSITFAAGNHQFNSGLSVTGNNDVTTFNPGTYYFNGTNLNITGTNDSIVYLPSATLQLSGSSSGTLA